MDHYGKAPKQQRTISNDFSHDLASVMKKNVAIYCFCLLSFWRYC